MNAAVPPWGTPATDTACPTERDYVVVGFHAANEQRWRMRVTATDPRKAEDEARAWLNAENNNESDPWACAVLTVTDGAIVAVDEYAYYLDPDIPAPEDAQ